MRNSSLREFLRDSPIVFSRLINNLPTQVVGDNAKTDPKRMGRGLDPYMIRYRSTRPRGGSVDCFGVGRRGSTPAWGRMEYIWTARGSVGEWKHIGSYMDPRVPRGGRVEFFDVMENGSAFI
uniref:Uncharacterized protein n=1 Tax=Caenorhabditis japonica TaxID=281687 RepID=A0A8R1ED77_CAEJA